MKISVNQYDVYPKFAFAGTRGSYGLDAVIMFCFSDEWNGLSKTVSFYPADGSDPVAVMIEENETINIPSEVMNAAGQAKYVISGVDGTDTIISVTGILQVASTLDCAENTTQEPTPTLMAQVYEKMTATQNAAEAAKESAAEAEEYVEAQQVSADEARAYTESALAAKNDAVTAKNDAVAAKIAAEAAAASIDISGKMDIVSDAEADNIAVFDGTGNVKDGKIAFFVDEDGILNIRFDEEE